MEENAPKKPQGLLACFYVFCVKFTTYGNAVLHKIHSHKWGIILVAGLLLLLVSSQDGVIIEDSFEEFHATLRHAVNQQWNSSVGYCIHGLEMMSNAFLRELKSARERALGRNPEMPSGSLMKMFNWKRPDGLGPHMRNYLDDINREYPFVETIYYERETSKMSVFLNDDYYDYSTGSCYALGTSYRQNMDTMKALYNLTCAGSIAETLEPVSLEDRTGALDIGMPVGYAQTGFSSIRHWTYLQLVSSAVINPYGEVSSRNMTLFTSGCTQPRSYSLFSSEHDEVFSIASGPSTDGILQEMPRLAPYLQYLLHFTDIKIHVGTLSPFLMLIGIPRDRFITGSVATKLAYIPAGLPCDTSDLYNTQLLSYYLRRSLPNLSSKRTKIILVSSADHKYKRHSDILDMLQKHAAIRSLEAIEYSTDSGLDIQTTQSLFNEAILVVSPTGPSVANILFCQPGTVVIQSVDSGGQEKSNMTLASLSLALGMRYFAILVDGQGSLDQSPEDIEMPAMEYLSNLRKIRREHNQPF